MKKLKVITISLVSILTISVLSCKKDMTPSSSKGIDEETEKMISVLAKTNGYDPNKISADAEYLYYTDLIFPKKTFWNNFSTTTNYTIARHYRTNTVTAVSTIRVNVYAIVPGAWQTAIIQAMAAWNGLNLTKTFVGVSSNTPISDGINISMGNPVGAGAVDVIAGANLPSGGYPGNIILINNSYANLLTAAEKRNVIAHEIGHCLGFLHTDGGQGTLINTGYSPCQNSTDPNSVMAPTNHTWYGFTTCDVLAFDAVY